MNEEQKPILQERYAIAKQKGVKFYPDIIYKDLIVSFALFILLIGLAVFIGVANEPKADPNDTNYIPRPEWYFLFLFEMLKFIPGSVEWLGTALIPGVAILILLLLPFLDKKPHRHWKKRKISLTVMSAIVLGMAGLTIRAAITTPIQAETKALATFQEKYQAGAELYSTYCVECHGSDGEGGEIMGVSGLEGTIVKAINSEDILYTRTDETLYNVIEYGQPTLKMPPFGKAYGGELAPQEIEAIVLFMRYTWDQRMELPQEAKTAFAIPVLKEGETAYYEPHIEPIVKRYCISCHRQGKQNNNYLMQSYTEVMQSGDHAPNVIPGDLNSNLMRMLYRETITAGGPMPPTKPLPETYIRIFENWIINGAQPSLSDPIP